MSDTEEYEYAYSSDEDGVNVLDEEEEEDDEYLDDASQEDNNVKNKPTSSSSGGRNHHSSATMDWETSNPNAAPTLTMTSSSSAHHHHHSSLTASSRKVKSGIRILNSAELEPELSGRVKELVEVLGIPSSASAILLREFCYSKERVLEQYMTDSDAVLTKCGVYHRVVSPVAFVIPSTSTMTCPICYDDMNAHNCLAMPCGHAFCADCWSDFCANAIQEGQSCVVTTCPQASCPERVTEDEFAKALLLQPEDDEPVDETHKAAFAKYQEFQLRQFVDSSPLTRWCPGKGCDKVAAAESQAAMEVEHNLAHCTCGTSFCMICGFEPHAPTSCKDLQRWDEKCKNESETANWILANTKSCPKCCARIEKNQGCNHMTCQKCKFEFCWICMGDWHNHGANTGGYYKCSRYQDGTNPDDPNTDMAKAKRELDRYLHYYRRYHAHQEAEKFARKQLKETEQRMIALQEASDDAKWADVEFLKTANVQLVECRRVLKYTYVFAYYLPSVQTAARERFEHHQEMLERFTENLSELSEKPLAEMDRTTIVNQTRVVDRFMKNILKYVEDGMEED